MNNLKTLVERSREKKALDEFIGAVYKKDGEIKFRFRKDYENLFVPAPLYNEFLGGKNYNGVIAFIIESPHIHEFKIDINLYPEGRYNARPLNNPSTKKYLKKMVEGPLKSFFSDRIKEGEIYLFLIVNSVQYQCSLGEKTDNYRDLLFVANWIKNCKADFLGRIEQYSPDLYINSCTKGNINKKFLMDNFKLDVSEEKNSFLCAKETRGILTLQDIVESALEIEGMINKENYLKYNHPSYFVYQEARGNGNVFYPAPKFLDENSIIYFGKQKKIDSNQGLF